MFELHITCSKSFKRLNIEFDDGTIINTENSNEDVKNVTGNTGKTDDTGKTGKTGNTDNINTPENHNEIREERDVDPRFRRYQENCNNQIKKSDEIKPKKKFKPSDMVDVNNRPACVAEELEDLLL